MSHKLLTILQRIIPENLHSYLVCSYDLVGDIAIIIVREELADYEELIAEVFLQSSPRIKVVAKRSGVYGGEFRILPLLVIAGENRTTTETKESGVRLKLDLAKTYFSVRSGGERLRVARLVESGENVLVPFSGIGPYPLVIAQHSQAQSILGVEKNKDAHSWAVENMSCNKRLKNVRFENADFYQWLENTTFLWDRIIMPLPKAGLHFVEPVLRLLKAGGWLHCYDMRATTDFDLAIGQLAEQVQSGGRRLMSARVVSCGHCSPRTFRICIDAQVGGEDKGNF